MNHIMQLVSGVFFGELRIVNTTEKFDESREFRKNGADEQTAEGKRQKKLARKEKLTGMPKGYAKIVLKVMSRTLSHSPDLNLADSLLDTSIRSRSAFFWTAP